MLCRLTGRSILIIAVNLIAASWALENKLGETDSGRSGQCRAGFYNAAICCSVSNATTSRTRHCTEVPLGRYSPENDDRMYKCPIGSYSRAGASKCTLCPPGLYSFYEGASACFTCPPGKYSKNPGSSDCSSCDTRFYNGPGSISVMEVVDELNGSSKRYCQPPTDFFAGLRNQYTTTTLERTTQLTRKSVEHTRISQSKGLFYRYLHALSIATILTICCVIRCAFSCFMVYKSFA
jgi:Tyrosine-protein kinase ephrin type A/B receptor-like